MIEELTQIAEIINNLGDKGLTAFLVWIIVDLAKYVIAWTAGAVALTVVAKRLGFAIQAFAKQE